MRQTTCVCCVATLWKWIEVLIESTKNSRKLFSTPRNTLKWHIWRVGVSFGKFSYVKYVKRYLIRKISVPTPIWLKDLWVIVIHTSRVLQTYPSCPNSLLGWFWYLKRIFSTPWGRKSCVAKKISDQICTVTVQLERDAKILF